MIYFVILFLLLLLSYYYDICKRRYGRDNWYYFIMVLLILVAGLRWRLGVDTPNYIYRFYYIYPTIENFSFRDYPIGRDLFYVWINSLVLSLGGKFYMVQLIQASFINILIFYYIKKHTHYIFTCVFFYYIMFYTSYNMEIMRGSMSIVVCLFANDYIVEKKWVKGYLLYLIAFMFHSQTLIILLTPILCFVLKGKKGYIFLICAFFLGVIIARSFSSYIEMLELGDYVEDKAMRYAESEKYGGMTKNINYIIVKIIPEIVYSLVALLYLKRNHLKGDMFKMEPFVLLGVCFSLIEINVYIAYRMADYYRLYTAIFLSEFFVQLVRNHQFNYKRSYFFAFVIFLPFFFTISYSYKQKAIRYYPYTSVIERKIEREREVYYLNARRPPARSNEY